MSQLLKFSGVDDFCHGGPKDSMHFLSLGPRADVYFPSRKRSRISAPPPLFPREAFLQKNPEASIDALPDECLFEILRRLPGGQERSVCAFVSKRWLMLLSTMHRDEMEDIESTEPKQRANPSFAAKPYPALGSKKDGIAFPFEAEEEFEDEKGTGFLSRSLEGKKASDVRLASVAVGTVSRGGLGKLSIRGNKYSRVTDFGLKAIGRCCPSLKSLSLWNIPEITDRGLSEIAAGCRHIEKLDIAQCPGVTDKSLALLAKSCPNLVSVTLESCSNIGNESLQALGQHCPNLATVTVKNCPLVGDQGVAGLFASAGTHLARVKLQSLNITDLSLAVIGHYGLVLTDLALTGLQKVNERGFWVMGNGQGLQKLRSLVVVSCPGVTDLGVEALGKGCPNLKQICFRKCPFLSDNGAVSLVKSAVSIESLALDECHRITQAGFFGVILCGKLKALSFANCFGIKDSGIWNPAALIPQCCKSLRSLSVSNCTGFGDGSLVILSKICPNLVHVALTGLRSITDHGLVQILQSCDSGLVKVDLSGCINVTEKTVLPLVKLHGETLEVLNLDGCGQVTDESLRAVAEHCSSLRELDVSKTGLTDSGVAALTGTGLRVLSLAGCVRLSDECLTYLCEVGPALAGLNIQGCSGISQRGVGSLVEMLWKCDILF